MPWQPAIHTLQCAKISDKCRCNLHNTLRSEQPCTCTSLFIAGHTSRGAACDAVIPNFHETVDKALSYLGDNGLLGVADFFVSSKWDLPLRQMPWARRFFWRCAHAARLGAGSVYCVCAISAAQNALQGAARVMFWSAPKLLVATQRMQDCSERVQLHSGCASEMHIGQGQQRRNGCAGVSLTSTASTWAPSGGRTSSTMRSAAGRLTRRCCSCYCRAASATC